MISSVIPEEFKEAISIALVKFIYERYARGYSAGGSVQSAAITGGIVIAADTVLEEVMDYSEGLLSTFGIEYRMYDIDVVRDGMIGIIDTLISRYVTYHNIHDNGGAQGLVTGSIYTGTVALVGDYLSKIF